MVTPLATPEALEPSGHGNEAFKSLPPDYMQAQENDMFTYPFRFSDVAHEHIVGTLMLDDNPPAAVPAAVCYRSGQLCLENGRCLDLIFTHSPATAGFMYLWTTAPEPHLFDIIGLPHQAPPSGEIACPANFCWVRPELS